MKVPTFQSLHLWTMAPELWVLATSIVVLVVALFMSDEHTLTPLVIGIAGLVGAFWQSAAMLGVHTTGFYGFIAADHVGAVINLVVIASALVALALSPGEVEHGPEYVALTLWAAIGMMVLGSATNLLTLFIGIEVLSLPLYILTGFHRRSALSGEASVKYLLLGAFSSGFLLYGSAFLYGDTGTLFFTRMAYVLTQAPGAVNVYLYLGMSLVLVGLSFKLAVIPFHMWVPDVYEGAPTPVTAFMSVGTKAAAFAAFLRVFLTALPPTIVPWQHAIWFLAVLTMLGGNLMALGQPNLKRMLGYSGIAHAGYLLVALVAATSRGVDAGLFYLLAYGAMNLGAFAVIVALSHGAEEGADISAYRGLFFRRPVLASLMTLFLFSLASVPPTAGFAGKFYILQSAVGAGDLSLAIVVIVATMISFYYYFRVIVAMFTRTEAAEPRAPVAAIPLVRGLVVASLVVAALGTLEFGIFPGGLSHVAQASTRILSGL